MNGRTPALLRRLALAVSTSCIFICFSELGFWARPTEGTTWPGALLLLLPYSFAAYIFLTAVSTFRVRSTAAIFLAATLFGWLVEGVIVQTAYGNLPFSLSFTGLAWHALLTVMVGWWSMQRALHTSVWRTLWLSALIGAAYGTWATQWWGEAPPIPLPDFAAYTFATALVLGAAYWVAARVKAAPFAPSRPEWVLMLLTLLAYFALVTVPQQPLAFIVLPPLVALVLLALWQNRRRETRDDAIMALYSSVPIKLYQVIPLLALPIAATCIYGPLLALHIHFPVGIVAYLVITPLGFLALLASLARMFRARRPAVHTADVTSSNERLADG
jgi:hypothetical protein